MLLRFTSKAFTCIDLSKTAGLTCLGLLSISRKQEASRVQWHIQRKSGNFIFISFLIYIVLQ